MTAPPSGIKIRVGITGQSGFIGRRLAQFVDRQADWLRVPFERAFFEDVTALRRFVEGCDAVVHLAARNRPTDDRAVFATNVRLTEALIRALNSVEKPPAVCYASSIREGDPTAFGRSKKVCGELFETWQKNGRRGLCPPLAPNDGGDRKFMPLRIPNVFGPGARPFDNSFIATFSHQLIHGLTPEVTENRLVPLLHVDSLCGQIAAIVRGEREAVAPDFHLSVADVLTVLRGFREEFRAEGRVAVPDDPRFAALREAFVSHL